MNRAYITGSLLVLGAVSWATDAQANDDETPIPVLPVNISRAAARHITVVAPSEQKASADPLEELRAMCPSKPSPRLRAEADFRKELVVLPSPCPNAPAAGKSAKLNWAKMVDRLRHQSLSGISSPSVGYLNADQLARWLAAHPGQPFPHWFIYANDREDDLLQQ